MLVQRVVSPFFSTLSEPGLPTRSVMPVWFICIWLPSLLVVDGLGGASRSTSQVVAAVVVAVVSRGETRRLLKVPLPAPTRRSSSPKLSLSTGSLKGGGGVVARGEAGMLLKVPLPAPTRRYSSPKLSLSTGSLKVRVMVVFSPGRRSLLTNETPRITGGRVSMWM